MPEHSTIKYELESATKKSILPIIPLLIILTLASTALALFFIDTSILSYACQLVLSTGIFLSFYMKYKDFRQINITNNIPVYLSLIAAALTAYENFKLHDNIIKFKFNAFCKLVGSSKLSEQLFPILGYTIPFICFFIIFAICFLVIYTVLCKYFIQWKEKSQKIEYIYLAIASIFYICLILFFYNQSFTFYKPENTDIIFTTDTTYYESHINLYDPVNDIRQPLYALFAAPFSVFAYATSKLFFFIPNAYLKFLAIVHLTLILISLVTVSRMVAKTTMERLFFLLLITTSFPVFLFAVTLEQYVVPIFYLIAFIYCCVQSDVNENVKNFFVSAATGCLVTSGFFIIALFNQSIEKSIKKLFQITLIFACITFILRPYLILDLFPNIDRLLKFSALGDDKQYSLYYRLCQFTEFVYTCFFAPATRIIPNVDNYISVQLMEPEKISVLGTLILLITLAGFWLNRRKKIAILSFYWIIFSFCLLAIAGWGSPENGMVLYSFYFFWAYCILFFLFITKVTENLKNIRYTAIILIIAAQIIINSKAMMNIVEFAAKYYPVK